MTLTLSRVVSEVESRHVFHALRYEPLFSKYVTMESVKRCIQGHSPVYMNRETAYQLMHFSFGAYQIMGENLYALGYSGSIAHYLHSETVQLAYFEKYIQSRNINYTLEEILTDDEKLNRFSVKYNGVKSYGQKLLAAYQELKGV